MSRFLLILVLILPVHLLSVDSESPWVVYYGSEAPTESFEPYSLIVLDADNYPTIEPLKERSKLLLAYLSVGSISQDRSWYRAAKESGVLIKEDQNFPGTYVIDVRNLKWTKQVIEKVIPQILHKGFNGLFLDTLDSPIELERGNPRQYGGMQEGAAKLVKAIRLHYPNIPIMMNRAYDILPQVAEDITYELSESDITTYNFQNKTYSFEPTERLKKVVATFDDVKKLNPELAFYALNFWDPKESDKIKEIYQISRESKLDPYVGTIDLDKIVPEPS